MLHHIVTTPCVGRGFGRRGEGEGDRAEGADKERHGSPCHQPPPAAQRRLGIRGRWMAESEHHHDDEPEQPSGPEVLTQQVGHDHHQGGSQPSEARDQAMEARSEQRVNDMAAVELADGQEVKCGHQ